MNELWVPQRAVAARLQCDECDCDGQSPFICASMGIRGDFMVTWKINNSIKTG